MSLFTARTEAGDRTRFGIGDVSGAVADLGILVPLVAALVLVNGLDAGSVLLFAGLLVLVSGAAFGIPFPVQPLKALTAVAVAERVAPGVIHAAGLEIGLFLLVISIRSVADVLARLFTHPVVRALQLGVGVLLVITAWKLVDKPPTVFRGTPPSPWPVFLAVSAFAAVVWAARHRRYVLALVLLGGGAVATIVSAGGVGGGLSVHVPTVSMPGWSALASAFFLLVVPQIPLTFGNAVVATTDLSHEYFGSRGSRVTPARVCVSAGVGNVVSALGGGMPMCHGAGGLTAHYRLGARTAAMNVLLGGALVVLGLFFAPQIPAVLGTLPVWVLAAFLGYAGIRHAMLIGDLRGFS
ncbi:MAG TPA: putative sulfate/molybdate transporter, partial [Actinomycetota bacterium]|nr:putative sulfate/molybdate transporter [Actinomycetota bacterium]